MARIKILSPEVRDKIAAGEVIARPVAVVKELIENSLDAHAKRIEIDIEDGGKQHCLVNDDGVGMNEEDALLAIERFSTSKISDLADIEKISTYGFRGEALASIAQISHFEMETSAGERGTKIIMVGGATKKVLESLRPRGTWIKVSKIFFNLPARLKFLKSAQWERRLIADLVKTYALINPAVYFNLSEAGRTILEMPGVDSVEKRIKMHFPRNLVQSLVNVDKKISSVLISGFFSRPDFFERHRMNYIYVNSRPVRYPRIYHAVVQAYQNPKTPPAFLINIDIEPSLVDVNIHPTKNEVKFKDERYIADLLGQAIKKGVFSNVAAADYVGIEKNIRGTEISPRSVHFVQEKVMSYDVQTAERDDVSDADEFWQIHNTYILSQTKSGLIIIDQHVAHERIIYESIMKGKAGAQRLLFPITLELTPEEYRAYKKTKSILKDLGVEFKEFSSHTVVIDSLPTEAQINREDIIELFKDIDNLGNLIKEKSEIAKVVACRSAIKAGQKLSAMEMRSLIDKLFACENPYTCPHGRPIVIKFTLDELASKFGRT
jgi:DNA mismatch repair protein MutL